ncbi:MAG: archease [Anaerolineales bacterium]
MNRRIRQAYPGQSRTGFQEIEHTADWALNVWAPNLTELFVQAAQGMYTLSGTHLQSGPRLARSLTVDGDDSESLLVNFLSELLFFGEQDGFAFDSFDLSLGKERLHARIEGAQIASQQKEIKAVTYHNLEVRSTQRGLEVTIVFDV